MEMQKNIAAVMEHADSLTPDAALFMAQGVAATLQGYVDNKYWVANPSHVGDCVNALCWLLEAVRVGAGWDR